ncbi:hypothetical protein KY333_03480 [Candidatus Woesearchaeota archaeon]|nr:hypothetical protein [Candidatus Woesearchaeota archaeon]MBW2994244.1 hypothetical protein [Candidatus Woesearchaeota archaeon]
MAKLDDIEINYDANSLEDIEARAAEDKFRRDNMLTTTAEKVAKRYNARSEVTAAFVFQEGCERIKRKVFFIEYDVDGTDRKDCIEWMHRPKGTCPFVEQCGFYNPRPFSKKTKSIKTQSL